MRTIIYVDGFNLYYGALKDTNYKWLDLAGLFRSLLRPENDIVKIKYFTAKIKTHSDDGSQLRKQMAYLRALRRFRPTGYPDIDIIYGHFSVHEARFRKSPAEIQKHPRTPKTVEVMRTEEKGSDVNLAVHMLDDCWRDAYDCAILVSNDSDFAEALRMVRTHRNKKIGLCKPKPYLHSTALARHAHFQLKLTEEALRDSQLPAQIPQTKITKPRDW